MQYSNLDTERETSCFEDEYLVRGGQEGFCYM